MLLKKIHIITQVLKSLNGKRREHFSSELMQNTNILCLYNNRCEDEQTSILQLYIDPSKSLKILGNNLPIL